MRTYFFYMCLTSSSDCGTTKTLFTDFEGKFEESSLPWNNYIGLSANNSNTIIGKHNSIAPNN